ncbi:hypothetical protein [Mucilaginibacter sp.]|uniref:hypothetical protein n=1 Tax=Mucilaginibacter sp. TaxID=1882438 RepID=UPI003D0A1584
MLKLYKQVDNEIHYWETWEKDAKTGVIHWGIVGEKGTQREVYSGIFSSFKKIVQKEIDRQLSKGYQQVDVDDHFTLLIEYKLEGIDTPEALDKRTQLQIRMNQTLGWTGLGHCDGGSIGSGTMEVCCLVVDFDIAKHIIEQDLKDTAFADYTRIYNEND